MGVFLLNLPGAGFLFQASTANWWERSPNYNNSNNFCNVNTNGNANNNNARNSNGLAPDFATRNGKVTYRSLNESEPRPLRKEKYFPWRKLPKLPFDAFARTLLAWREDMCLIPFHVPRQSSLGALYITTVRKANKPMNSEERREARYQRRKARREKKKAERSEAVGGLADVFTFNNLYTAGKKCCNGVRWKNSTQRFELHLFSGTARRRKLLLSFQWKPCDYVHFTISERGKTRPIDAPRIQDRQIHKVYTQKVLLPLYLPDMIWNNGASLPGKGFQFSKELLKNELRYHFRRHGRDGYIILLDFKQFFPSALHSTIYARHDRLMFNDDVRRIGDDIVRTVPGDRGLPLGVEPSQAEMIAFPSPLDNYIKCQLSIKCAGHYMDDYYVVVPPDRDPHEILRLIISKAESIGLTVSKEKTRIVPLTKPFRYCKAKYTLTETGRVVVNGNRDGIKRARRKLKAFRAKIDNGEMTYEDLWTSVNAMLAYFGNYDDHMRVLKLRRLFYAIFGFSPEHIENFRKKRN